MEEDCEDNCGPGAVVIGTRDLTEAGIADFNHMEILNDIGNATREVDRATETGSVTTTEDCEDDECIVVTVPGTEEEDDDDNRPTLILLAGRQGHGGPESDLVGKTQEEVEALLEEAREAGNTQEVRRIQRHQKYMGWRGASRERGLGRFRFNPFFFIEPVWRAMRCSMPGPPADGCPGTGGVI